jgi:hypothetical protein
MAFWIRPEINKIIYEAFLSTLNINHGNIINVTFFWEKHFGKMRVWTELKWFSIGTGGGLL